MSKHSSGKRSQTYISWAKMKMRCNNPNHHCYNKYGGRGISYNIRWELFTNFLEDMGESPVDYTLDRLDINQHYSKENCRWATRKEQAQNRGLRSDNLLGIAGVTLRSNGKYLASYWVGRTQYRLYYGHSLNDAITARQKWESEFR